MRIDKGDTVAVFDILNDHIFEESRLSGTGLPYHIAVAQTVGDAEFDRSLLRAVPVDTERNAVGRHFDRRRRLLGERALQLARRVDPLGSEVKHGRDLRERERDRVRLVENTVGKIAQEAIEAPARYLFEHQTIALRVVVLAKGRDKIAEDIFGAPLCRRRGGKADQDRPYLTLDLALYLLGRDLVGLPAESALFFRVHLHLTLHHHVRHVVEHLPDLAFRNGEGFVQGLALLEAPQHFFVVVVVAVALGPHHDLERGALAVLRDLCKSREQHVHRVVLEHIRSLQGIRGGIRECRVRGRMLAFVIENIVIAALFVDARIGEHGGDEAFGEVFLLPRHGKIEDGRLGAFGYRYLKRESLVTPDKGEKPRIQLLRR